MNKLLEEPTKTDLESRPGVLVIPVPRAHRALALHEVGHDLELLGVHVAVAVEVEHLERDLEVAARGREHSEQEDVVGEGDEAALVKRNKQLF